MVTMGFFLVDEYQTREAETFQRVATSLKNAVVREQKDIQKRYAKRIAGFVKSNQAISQAFIRQDHDQLVNAIRPRLETIHKEDSFFYAIVFICKDGRVFHNSADPRRIGEDVSKIPFVKESMDSKQPVSGLSVARNGLAYRFSYPLFDGPNYVGTIVFVVNATRPLEVINQDFGAESGIFVHVDYTAHLANRQRFVMNDKMLLDFSGTLFADKIFLHKLSLDNCGGDFVLNGQIYKKFPPLGITNFNGVEIGEILTIMNFTAAYAGFSQALRQAALVCSLVFVITIVVLYLWAGFFLGQVKKLQQQLELKVARRTKALREANQQLAREVEERKLSQQALKDLSEKDMLTGLNNRRKFAGYYATEWNAALREQRVISLLMIDIDCFKAYNDKYGHLAGDEALAKVAATLQEHVTRPRDFVARYGGEEFVCLLPETTMDAAIKVAEKLRKKIEELQYVHEFSQPAKVVTISVGIATMIPHHGQAKEDLIDQADKALYRAKNEGRNRIKAA